MKNLPRKTHDALAALDDENPRKDEHEPEKKENKNCIASFHLKCYASPLHPSKQENSGTITYEDRYVLFHKSCQSCIRLCSLPYEDSNIT